ncbi:MAG: hypothetical protein ACI4RO_03320 [Candidatus Scatosoma sp.]
MKNRHEKFKLTMKIIGLILLIGGIAFIVVGGVDFFKAMSEWRQPEKFWAFFVGFPLFAIGLSMTLIGFHREIARYMKDEMAPVINETAKDISPAVEETAKAAAEGVKKGLEQGGTEEKNGENGAGKEE